MNSILIVDDTAFTRLVLRNMFEKLGIEVVAEADSGEEAVRNYCLYRPSLDDGYYYAGHGWFGCFPKNHRAG